MMKYLLLLFVFNLTMFSTQNENIDDFYNITSKYLNILNLNEDALLFYGSDGGVLRTYDNGITWKQKYSGTKSYIRKIIMLNNILFGITDNGELMISDNLADTWKITKLSNVFTDINHYEENIYITTDINKILMSTDFGNSWIEHVVGSADSLKSISIKSNNIIVTTKDFRLLQNDLNFDEWEEINSPINGEFKVKNKNNELYLYNKKEIAKYKTDLNWDKSIIFGATTNFEFIEYKGSYLIFESNFSPTINYYNFNLFFKELKLINTIDNFYFGKYLENNFGFIINDIEINNDILYLSNLHKTIFRSSNFEDWELVNITPNVKTPINIIDSLNWVFTPYLSEFPVFTNDGGITFKQGDRYSGYIDDIKTYFKTDQCYYDKNGNGFNLYNERATNELNNEISNYFRLGISNYFGKSNKLLDINLKPSNTFTGFREYIIHGEFDDNFIFSYSYSLRKENLDKTFSDSIYVTELYKVNKYNYKTEKFHEIIDSFKINEIYYESNNIWVYGNNALKNQQHSFYLSKDKGESFIKAFELPSGKYRSFFKSKNGKYYSIANVIYEIDENYNVNEIEFDNSYKNVIFQNYANANTGFLEDKYFYLDKEIYENNDTILEFFRLIFDFEFSNKIIESEYIENIEFFKNNNYNIMIKYAGIENFIYKNKNNDIELTSIINGGPPSIWTYPPYPNPIKDRLKMKFYSAMMNNIVNLKVELIEIGSGRVYNITDYKLSKTDEYFGEIDINISSYNSGAYLINFKLGESNKSESIIIE